jgi:hypothetical protein
VAFFSLAPKIRDGKCSAIVAGDTYPNAIMAGIIVSDIKENLSEDKKLQDSCKNQGNSPGIILSCFASILSVCIFCWLPEAAAELSPLAFPVSCFHPCA